MGESVFRFKKNMPKGASKGSYYFLSGREKIIKTRKERELYSSKKITIAKHSASLIANIPSVLFVGITGSLAMRNAKLKDDIDLIVITHKNTLWLTRFLVLMLLKINNVPARRFGQKQQEDKLCLNMWLDEEDLQITPSVFAAHELIQIIPLVNKQNTHEKLLAVNNWHKKYWPNASLKKEIKPYTTNLKKLKHTHKFIGFIEPLFYWVQKTYMKRHKTRETVTKTRAFFHPVDWEKKVIKKLALRGLMLK